MFFIRRLAGLAAACKEQMLLIWRLAGLEAVCKEQMFLIRRLAGLAAVWEHRAELPSGKGQAPKRLRWLQKCFVQVYAPSGKAQGA